MAPRGGYRKPTDREAEYVRLDRTIDAEAKLSARDMGQTYEVWFTDAVEHHIYRCEMIQLKEQYRQDCKAAADALKPSPLESDYMPQRPAPTITREQPGPGSSSRGPKARP